MNNEFHEKLTRKSEDWASSEQAAALAEAYEEQFFAKQFLINKASMGVEEAKQAVRASEDYYKVKKAAIEARYMANLTRRALRDAETSFERWRTQQANERFTARTAT